MRVDGRSITGLRGLASSCYCDDGSTELLTYGSCDDGSPAICDSTSSVPNIPATYACLYGGTYPYCLPAPTGSGTMPTQANTTAGLTALQQLTQAATSRLTALPGQTSLQPGQTLTMGPGGTFQISAAGTQPGLTAGLSTGSLSGMLPLLLIGGLAIVLMGRK